MGARTTELVADYVIVGAGSAGCVLAGRLSEDPASHVLLLEAGGDDRPSRNPSQFMSNVNIHLPAGFTNMLSDPKLNWNYRTDPDPGTNGRTHHFPRGKVLGGSSSINGMLYVRGLPEDYDGWRQLGCTGWSWSDVEPLFGRIENQLGAGHERGGTGGPLHVSGVPMRHPMIARMMQAFGEAGAPISTDLNGTVREGVSGVRLNIRNGRRVSSAVAYLHPAMRRPNLRVETRAIAVRLLFEGKRAVGVEFDQGGERRIARARREVIVSGGAINSPQLLELSGIGGGARLQALGIEVIADNPGVGENLQDHFATMVRARLKPGTPSFNSLSRGVRLAGQLARYAFTRTGLLALGGSNLTAFLKSDPALDLPDLQFFASPATVDFASSADRSMKMEALPGLTVGAYVMRPRSRGSVHLRSNDFRDHPVIAPHYLEDSADQRAQVAGLRWSRRVLAAPALAPLVDHELTPGAELQSDKELLGFARASGSTGFHQSCTCAMGTGPNAVVDPALRVRGVDALRVVDASVMPNVVSGNTHAATVMIAERGVDLIRAEAR